MLASFIVNLVCFQSFYKPHSFPISRFHLELPVGRRVFPADTPDHVTPRRRERRDYWCHEKVWAPKPPVDRPKVRRTIPNRLHTRQQARNPGTARHMDLSQPRQNRTSPINGPTNSLPRSGGYS